MKSGRLQFKAERFKTSYDFKRYPDLPDSFENNWKNNSRDWLILLDGNTELRRWKCQTVANYCFGAMATADTIPCGDTVAPGEFTVECFVPPRGFHGEIHAITRTRDIDGQWIDHHAMQTTAGGFQNGRWLIHDRFSVKLGKDSDYAWSAGCFILASQDLAALNQAARSLGVIPGDLIPGMLLEL
ncbi:MAG: hypothetical protein LBQ88_05055 [Treponema sp.]|jgi:hypothetical protein|nr:hypothetical protein [Treponema sp.]